MKAEKTVAAVLCAALITGGISGCGKGDSGKDGAADAAMEPVKGRYVETEVSLPEQLEDWTVKQLFTEGDQIHLLAARQEAGKMMFQEWEQTENGFDEVTLDWLAQLALPVSGEWTEIQMLSAGAGNRILYTGYVAEGEEDFKTHLWTGENGAPKEITPEQWIVPDEEWGGYEMLTGIAALENGTLTAVTYTSVEILDGQTGNLLEKEATFTQYDNVVSDGENIWFYATHSDSEGLTLEKRREGKSAATETIHFSQGNGQMKFAPGRDGTLILAGSDGIFRGTPEGRGGSEAAYTKGNDTASAGAGGAAGEEQSGAGDHAGQGPDSERFAIGTEDGIRWEKLLAGAETDFTLTDRWCTGIVSLENGALYALFQKSGGAVLKKYEYDPNAVIEVTEELKLYTVQENTLLRQAAAMYHREHPEVMINIEYAYPQYYYDETDYNEVYQKLNTMLMGEAAPDILVLDHLDIDSYAEKGLLENINDVVGPMEEKGELLSSITSAYLGEDGSRYVVPLEFAFFMAVGRDITAQDMTSVEALGEFLSGETYSYMGPLTVNELVDRFYPYFCGEIIDGKQLNREALGSVLEALKAIEDNSGYLDTREKEDKAANMWSLASGTKLAFEKVAGFNDAMFPLAIADYIQGDFTAFENCFIPMAQMGICSKSAYKDRAKDFLQFILSEAVQQMDPYGGFPVNAAALKECAAKDRSEAEAETDLETDGGYVEFRISVYPPETAETLMELCKGLEKPAVEDEKIREVLTESLEGYLKGEQSLEDTVQKVEDGLKMYLAE